MASPQWEEGFTKIANELLEALYRHRLGGSEVAVVLAVMRLSYGWRRKFAPVSIRELASEVGADQENTRKVVARLIAREIIEQTDDGLEIQKNFDRWKSPVKTTGKNYRSPVESTGKNYRKTPVKTTGNGNGYPAPGADIQPPKERKERERNSQTVMSLSSDELEALRLAGEGVGGHYQDYPKSFTLAITSRVGKGYLPLGVDVLWAELGLNKQARWICRALELAKANAKQRDPNGLKNYAIKVIANKLDEGGDLIEESKIAQLEEARAKQQAKRRSTWPFSDRPWGFFFAPERIGSDTPTVSDVLGVADRTTKFRGWPRLEANAWIDKAVSIAKEQGIEAGMEFIWPETPECLEEKARKEQEVNESA